MSRSMQNPNAAGESHVCPSCHLGLLLYLSQANLVQFLEPSPQVGVLSGQMQAVGSSYNNTRGRRPSTRQRSYSRLTSGLFQTIVIN
jgi:hypothetical protein